MLKKFTDDFQPVMTARQIAEEMGISISRVYQLENRAIQKIRRACRQRGLTINDFFDALPIERHDQ